MIFCFIEGAFIYISNRFWNLLASYQADRKSCRLIQRVCMVEVLLMVFWLFSYEQRHNRFAEITQSCGNLVTYFFCRWLGNDDDHFHCIVVLHSVDHVHHGNPTYRGVQVSSSDTNGICHTLAQTVDDRCQFLDSCPRRPDNTNGARSYIICKCNRNTLNDPRTTVRSHHSQSLFVRLLFQLHFVF